MQKFQVPTREQVSESNQAIFDKLKNQLGFVPNLYAYYAKNDTALADYLNFANRKSTLKAKEKEIINLVVSQFNGCQYCLAAHTAIGKMNGFNDDQILEIRTGEAKFDEKLNQLAKFTLSAVQNKGGVDNVTKEALFDAGYNEANLIDITLIIGEKTISNYIHNLAGFEIDFPLAKQLEQVSV